VIERMAEADYIIVGGGTAGCVVARRLLEWTDARVLLLEAGPDYPRWALDPPLASLRLRRHWSWPLVTVPQPRLGGRTIAFPMGRVVGGSSSINAMMFVPGAPADHDDWERAGGPDWGRGVIAEEMRRIFGGGPGSLAAPCAPRYRAEFSERFLAAAEAEGLRRVAGLHAGHGEACGYFDVFQLEGRRAGVATTSLAPWRGHPRLALRTRRRVRRLLLEGPRVVGVEVGDGRAARPLRARRGVILTAGTFHSPHLLLRSGIGPPAELEEARVPVRHALLAVGRGLEDHVGAVLRHPAEKASPGRRARWLVATLEYLRGRDGVMRSNCCEAGGFFATEPGDERPTIEIVSHFQSERHDEVSLDCILLRPHSRGTVRLNPGDPEGPPRIDPAYLEDERDRSTLGAGVRRARDILRRIFPASGLLPVLPDRGAEDAFLAAQGRTNYHPTGTCRMGATGVVDARLQVHGLEGLWVGDASAIPASPTGHTAVAAILFGERAARFAAGGR